MIDVKDNEFEDKVIKASENKLIVVDFWAPWCGPCRLLGPGIESAVENFGSEVVLVKVNVDENPRKAQEFGVMSIPSVKFFKDRDVVDEFVGVKSEEEIKAMLEKHL